MSGGIGVLCFYQVTSEADRRNSALTRSSSRAKHQQSRPPSSRTPSPPKSFATLVLHVALTSLDISDVGYSAIYPPIDRKKKKNGGGQCFCKQQ